MKHEVTGAVDLVSASKQPVGRFFVQAKLPGDDEEGHPHGQWSLAVEPVVAFSGEGVKPFDAFLAFVAPDAPHGALKRGLRIELYRGTELAGTATVTRSSSEADIDDLPMDHDFLPSMGEDFLQVA